MQRTRWTLGSSGVWPLFQPSNKRTGCKRRVRYEVEFVYLLNVRTGDTTGYTKFCTELVLLGWHLCSYTQLLPSQWHPNCIFQPSHPSDIGARIVASRGVDFSRTKFKQVSQTLIWCYDLKRGSQSFGGYSSRSLDRNKSWIQLLLSNEIQVHESKYSFFLRFEVAMTLG